MALLKENATQRRARRVRHKLRTNAPGKLRFSVFRSQTHIYAQIIDDTAGHTLVSASTLDKGVRKSVKNSYGMESATAVGKAVGERAVKAGITEVYFDRGSYRYTGRLKALADAAREAGLKF